MRARLRKKLIRREAVAKLCAIAELALIERARQGAAPFASVEECLVWCQSLAFICDFEHYRLHGRPLIPGICWVNTECGPLPVWAKKERRMKKDSRKVLDKLRNPLRRGQRPADCVASNAMEEALAATAISEALKKPHPLCGGGLKISSVEGHPEGTYKGFPLLTCSKCGTAWQLVGDHLSEVCRMPSPWRGGVRWGTGRR